MFNKLFGKRKREMQPTENASIPDMDKNQFAVFTAAFLEANHGQVKFPARFHFDKINEIEFYTDGMRGGFKVRFFIKKNDLGEWYLDLFGSDDYSSWHKRILQNGDILPLENFMGGFGRPIYPDDPERTAREHQEIQDNNNRVHQLLIEKGLERNFENPDFERENVVKLVDYKWD